MKANQPRQGELILQNDLRDILKRKLRASLQKEGLTIETRTRLPYDVTVYEKDGRFRAAIGFLQQDIVIGRHVGVDEGMRDYVSNVRIKKKCKLVIPRAVIEVKFDVDSQTLMTCSHIAERLRQVAGGLHCYLLIRRSVKGDNVLLRHGSAFDAVVLLGRPQKGGQKERYRAGQFEEDLKADSDLRKKFADFVKLLRQHLEEKRIIAPPPRRRGKARPAAFSAAAGQH